MFRVSPNGMTFKFDNDIEAALVVFPDDARLDHAGVETDRVTVVWSQYGGVQNHLPAAGSEDAIQILAALADVPKILDPLFREKCIISGPPRFPNETPRAVYLGRYDDLAFSTPGVCSFDLWAHPPGDTWHITARPGPRSDDVISSVDEPETAPVKVAWARLAARFGIARPT